MLTRVLALFASSLCAACLLTAGRARAAVTVAGRYGELLLAVTGDRVTGAFTSQRGRNRPTGLPPFSRAFLLQGRLVDGHARSAPGRRARMTWSPGI